MTDEQKQAYDMYKSGMTLREVADKLGITRSAAKSRYERAKAWAEADPSARKAATAVGAEMVPHSAWHKEDGVSVYYKYPQIDQASDLLADVAEAFANIPAYVPTQSEFVHSDLMTVYGLFDLHIGALAWGRETRGPDYDLALFQSDITSAMDRLSSRAPASGHALVVIGGDSLHTPNSNNETPAHKHKLSVDGRFEKIVDVAVDALSQSIEILAARHARVSVVVVRGNHCEESHIILKVALKQRYRNVDRIDFPIVQGADKSEIFWMKHGKNLIAVHHGDKARPEKLAMIVADKCGFWDQCTASRVILTGHVHHLRTLDLVGATHYSLRAFAPPDSHGANFGGVRGLQAMTFDPNYGLIAQTHDGIWRADD